MKHSSASAPFGSARRRALASACREVPRTRTDLARQLGVERGSIETSLKAMIAEGILEPTQVPHARAKAFRLKAGLETELDAATAAAHPPGAIRPGLRLLIVSATRQAAIAEGLRAGAADPSVVWALRVDGPARYVFAHEASTPEEVDQVDRLQAIFAEAGADCLQFVVSDLMDVPRLRQHARTLDGRPHPQLLPPAVSRTATS